MNKKKFLVWTDFSYEISRDLMNKFDGSPYNFEEVRSDRHIALSFGHVDVFFSNNEDFASRPGRRWDKLFIMRNYPSNAVLNRVTGITLGYDDLYYDVMKVITGLSSDFMNKCLNLSKPKFIPDIKDVIFNNPATIVFWADGSKTVVKCQDDDIYDPEKGLAMAISKKALGNQGNYCNDIKKWLPEEEDFEDRVAKGIGDLIKEAFTTPKLGEYDPSPAKKALLALLRVQGKHNRALKKDYEEAVDEAYGYILEALKLED